MALNIVPISPAELLQWQPWPHSDDFAIDELRFEVPLQYLPSTQEDEKLEIVARLVYATAGPAAETLRDSWASRPILLYLCGGPGADNPPCRIPAMNRWLLEKGYSILYVNYRGCGPSSPLRAETLCKKPHLRGDIEKAQYISHFGQDNIVRDLEAMRHSLSRIAGSTAEIKWTTLGQSYGGYISLSYLSMHPEGLQEVFITGGLPPCGMDLDDYFRVEYEDIVAKNKAWYGLYPDGDALVRRVLALIADIGPRNVRMTGRGYLTGQKLLTLGRQFGSKVGFPEVYDLLRRIERDLASPARRLRPDTVREFEGILHVDERPLYPLMLEQTWCSGGRTDWAAERVARDIPGFEYLRAYDDDDDDDHMQQNGNNKTENNNNTTNTNNHNNHNHNARTHHTYTYPDPSLTPPGRPIYFTANTYGRFHYDTHEALVDLRGAAEALARHPWPCPYDYARLAANRVPAYAVIFARDMHLDAGVAADTASRVGGLRRVLDPGWHQDIRHRAVEVLENLWKVRRRTAEEDGEGEGEGEENGGHVSV